jgi:multidrug resistance efflux pump
MKVVVLLTAALIAGGTAAFWIAGALPFHAAPPPPSTSPPTLTTPDVIRAVGYVEPTSDVRKLTFEVDGVIEDCRVSIGQQVRAHDELAILRNNDQQADVAVAEAQLIVAQAERDKLLSGVHPRQLEATEHRVARLQERARYAQRLYNRQMDLYAGNAGTQEGVEQARSNLNEAEAALLEAQADLNKQKTSVRDEDVALAKRRVQLAEANLLAAKERLNDTILRAPIDGAVLEILKHKGESVKAFDPVPVLLFADVSQLRVRAEVDEKYVSLLRPGQDVVMYGRNLGDRRPMGKIALVKAVMGKKTVFTRDAAERKDLNVLQVFVEPTEPLEAPIGLRVDVEIQLTDRDEPPAVELPE